TILDPTAIIVGTFIPGTLFETSSCINGGIVGFSAGCDVHDGPGIAHEAYASISGGFAAGNGTLFTITYTAVAAPGASVFYLGLSGNAETVTTNNGLNFLADPSGFNV